MNYVQWHVGDWISGTSLLSATERGVYMDLLVRYYKEERPIMQLECKRIARAYAPHEQEAMQYVLSAFFVMEDGAYRHARCDEEIAAFREKSRKRSNAAKSRWLKGREAKSTPENEGEMTPETDSNAYAIALQEDMQTACEPVTNNQEPITNRYRYTSTFDENDAETEPDENEQADQEPAEEDLESIPVPRKPRSDVPPCPYERIVEMYHSMCPQLPGIGLVTKARQTNMQARWRQLWKSEECKTVEDGLNVFRQFFTIVQKSSFLQGKCPPREGSTRPWRANFDWLMKEANFIKVCEDRYVD